jgi:uncharacterized protein YigE (DUF2233 family)
MKVSELIKKLEKLNQNTEFVIKGGVYDEEMVELILFIDLEETTIEEVDLHLMSNLVEE